MGNLHAIRENETASSSVIKMMIRFCAKYVSLAIFALGWLLPTTATGQGGSAVVVYNQNVAGSGELARYYATRRGVPSQQVFGLDLPRTETMTRREYRSRMQEPLLKKLEESKLFSLKSGRGSQGGKKLEIQGSDVIDARIRYAVLCYGVPLKIANDPRLNEKEAIGIPAELRKNEAAVDSELAQLPILESKRLLTGPLRNLAYGATNVLSLHPTNGVLMVARLDGPSLTIARGLVDKAIKAETEGLWGRAYFDARGLTNGTSKLGDDWIKGAALVSRRLGFETVLNDGDERFSKSFPMSHVALYAGWYEYNGQVSGPFTLPQVEFVPGAFAYHLHSYSASTIRSDSQQWVGPLLAKGVTATMGAVYEPYLEFTPNAGMFFHRLVYMGFTLGEAAYACQGHLSWQMTVVGDPLYRPFARKLQDQHQELVAERSKWLEWSLLKVVNINQEKGLQDSEMIQFLEDVLKAEKSSVLLEKLGDLLFAQVRFSDAASAYRKALDHAESRQQRIRLFFNLGRTLESSGKADETFDLYVRFVKEFPNYPDLLTVYKSLVDLSKQLKKSLEQERYQREVSRLSNLSAHSIFK